MGGRIAGEPADSQTIYTCEGPGDFPAGARAFRTDDGGGSWTPITDGLQRQDPVGVQPSCIAVQPAAGGSTQPSTGRVYLGTKSGRVYVSVNKGADWLAPFDTGGEVLKLVIDPRTAADPGMTVVYAACGTGVWRSADGAATSTQVLSGGVTDFAARFPSDGTPADLYAGRSSIGVFHATDQTMAWTNLTAIAGTALPQQQPMQNVFDDMRIDVCVPTRRVYVWFFYQVTTLAL